ncbi:MAG: MAPEG family protein [Hyphomicrobiaceae bacterium]
MHIKATKQVITLISIIVALASSAMFIWGVYTHWPFARIASEPLQMWALCAGVAAITLVGAVVGNANARFFHPELIDGTPAKHGSAFEISQRCLQNTLEQLAIFICATASLSAVLRPSEVHILPILTAWFVFARLVFWVGYRLSPQGRAFGFAATIYPSIGVLIFTFHRAWLS